MGRYDDLYLKPGVRLSTYLLNKIVDALNELADRVFSSQMKMRVLSFAPVPGVNNAYGNKVSMTPPSGKTWAIFAADLRWTGSFQSNEESKIRITATYSDNSSLYIERYSTTPEDVWLMDYEVFSLWKDGVGIVEIDVDSLSNQSSTSIGTNAIIYIIEA
jgi:hypothetical protein